MDENLRSCIDLLNKNDTQVRNNAVYILVRLCEKIISAPNEEHYRRVRVSNPAVLEKLLPASGAMECLFEIGFIEDGEYLSLPREAPLFRLRQVQKALRELQTGSSEPQSSREESKKSKSSKIVQKFSRKANLLDRVTDEFRQALKYEDPQLQSKARGAIPLERLQIGAVKRMRELQRIVKLKRAENANNSDAEHQITVDDFLLVELLDWFKNEFFTWVDSPECSVCEKSCQYERVELSTDPRISRIEIHKCNDCGLEAKFPRYTDPGILLKTRRGRCGEWANAFTLICRSLGFDTRLAHDETDHVWAEVWSIASNRWIHADPCENAVDRPLMYERGWKKKLTYVLAYSRDEVQDVTWRYTRNPSEVLRRRLLCTEEDLVAQICRLNDERQNSPGYSAARKQFVTKRRALELVEMIYPPPGVEKPSDNGDSEYGGRTSGSVAWRTSRGETQETHNESFVWKIPEDARNFEFRYFILEDEYEAVGDDYVILKRKAGWQNGVDSVEGGVFRKVETDWEMVYLVRSPGQSVGKVTWTLETANSRSTIANVKLCAASDTFHGARVRWTITGSYRDPGINDVVLTVDDSRAFESSEINGASRISVTAEMSGGKDEHAWQHAQVFRQKLKETKKCSMSLSIRTNERAN